MKRLPLIALTSVVLLAVAAAGAVWRLGDRPSPPQSEAAAEDSSASDVGGPFTLTDQNGMRRTDKDFRGKFMLVFFGYTYCPDICPTSLAVEAEALEAIGSRAGRVVPIFISVDPQRDTPDKLKSYLASFDPKPPSTRPNFVGLTGSDEEIAQAAKAYQVYYKAHITGLMGGNSEYAVDHTGNIYLMDPEGKFVVYYSPGIVPDEMAADLMMRLSPAD